MTSLFLFSLTRFIHILSAVILVGGTIFIRFVLQPAAAATLSPDQHDQFRAKVMSRWKWIVHRGIGLLLISGLINYGREIATGTHKGDGLYHALLGIKIILAFAIFFIASVLVGRSPKFESWRKDIRKWLAINIALAVIIIAISGFLKVRTGWMRDPANIVAPADAEIGAGS